MPIIPTPIRRRAAAAVVASRPPPTQVGFPQVSRHVVKLPVCSYRFNHDVRRSSSGAADHTGRGERATRSINGESGTDERKEDGSASPPLPPPKGELSIVFTDIVKSTAIWESNATAMATGMQIHDNIIRSLTIAHSGYEVKQNGDGFMVAFSTAVSALQFCLAVQQQLLDQKWPEELMRLQPGKEARDEEGNVLFRGLRLRMSAHWGEPVCVWNDVISRMDYLGPMVNRAARFIQVTEGGQIVVSEEFLEKVRNSTKGGDPNAILQGKKEDDGSIVLDLHDLECPQGGQKIVTTDQRFEVRLLGKHRFKGVSDPQKLYFIVPRSLHGRLDWWPKHKYIAGSKGNIVSESN